MSFYPLPQHPLGDSQGVDAPQQVSGEPGEPFITKPPGALISFVTDDPQRGQAGSPSLAFWIRSKVTSHPSHRYS
jgi:hypothetical protein